MQADRPIGTMSAFITEDAGEKTATIVGVFVAKESRGSGIGGQLLHEVLQKLRQDYGDDLKIKLTVNTEQTAAVHLYEKFGFIITAEETVLLGDGKTHQKYVMKLV
jgi:ribosomal protein S18 acetylase RimI-like enzyme